MQTIQHITVLTGFIDPHIWAFSVFLLVMVIATAVGIRLQARKTQHPSFYVYHSRPLSEKPEQSTDRGTTHSNTPAEGIPETDIIPLKNFDWSTAEPLKLRTFKPRYHLTMGIERLPTSDWLQIDRHYRTRIEHRKTLMRSNRDRVLRALPATHETIQTLYRFLVQEYLPIRYPQIFKAITESSRLLNRVTNTKIPMQPSGDAESLLELLGGQVEEDFLILQPDKASGEFMLGAYMACFPNGFDWAHKLGKTMSQIHVPVPDYELKLKKSLNRYLGRIEPGQSVKRHNWSISTSGNLFSVSNVHLYEGETAEEEHVDFKNASLRCERQVLHRLKGTEDVILTIRTYLYPLQDIKDEGSGPDLAAAIDGLQQGSSPAMYFYKRAPNWGRAVKEFLLA